MYASFEFRNNVILRHHRNGLCVEEIKKRLENTPFRHIGIDAIRRIIYEYGEDPLQTSPSMGRL
jgi:hypothetical protein